MTDDFFQRADPSTLSVILLFGGITFVTVTMASRTWLLGDNRAIRVAIALFHDTQSSMTLVERNFVSIFALLCYLTMFGVILLAAYLLQHHPPFPHAPREAFDADYLVFLVLIILGYSLTTWQRNDGQPDEKESIPAVETVRSSENLAVTFQSGGSSTATREGGGRTSQSRSVRSNRSGRSNRSDASSRQSGHSQSSSHGSVEEIDWQQDRKSVGSGDKLPSILSTAFEEEETAGDQESLAFLSDLRSSTGLSLKTTSTGKSSHASRTSQQSTDSQDRVLEEVKLEDESFAQNTKHRSIHSRSWHSGTTGRSSPPIDDMTLLNPHQSLEWKGILSVCFLVYKLAAADVDPLMMNHFYNASHVGCSCFVFLTGFGHCMYFYKTNDYRFTRVLRVVVRINLVAVWMCMTMGHRYIFYYACPLHTLSFLVTYGTMRISKKLNYSKYGARKKLLGLGGIILLVWDFNFGLFHVLFVPFFPGGPSVVGAPNGPLYEWYYQSHVHHWAVFVGMVYALNYPITRLVLSKTENLGFQQEILCKGAVIAGLVVALTLWSSGPFSMTKYSFDSTQPCFVFLPILAYIYVRNLTGYLRDRHLGLFKVFGTHTLELYLMHHHFFLANGGESMLVLLPGYPKCNILLTGPLLLLVARLVQRTVSILWAMALPLDDEAKSVRSLVAAATCAMSVYGLAFFLHSFSLVSMGTIVALVVIGGILLYQMVMDSTWERYRGMQLVKQSTSSIPEESPIAKMSPLVIGTMVILLLGVGCHVNTLIGPADVSAPLLPVCEMTVNNGKWAAIEGCTEFQRGLFTREFDVGFYYGSCGNNNETLQWGWEKTRYSSRCPVYRRNAKQLQRRLANQSILFIGDETVRKLFDALCRALGDVTAGAYDAAVSEHVDISKNIDSIRMEYKWAPLVFDQVSKLRDIRSKGMSTENRPTLVAIGGGPLDCLHVSATGEDQQSHRAEVQKMAKELAALDSLQIPTIWCTPPLINTPALGNEEKRNQMSEMAVSEMRKMYAETNVEGSASFVLDGPSYSEGRVADSYDGVSYPASVYDAGIQIMANSFDWLIPEYAPMDGTSFVPLSTGTMGNPFYGIMMLCFSLIGLFFFDGYFGFAYLSSLLMRQGSRLTPRKGADRVPLVTPSDLYEEAFALYHQRFKLPSVESTSASRQKQVLVHEPSHDYSESLSLIEHESRCSATSRQVRKRGESDQTSLRQDDK